MASRARIRQTDPENTPVDPPENTELTTAQVEQDDDPEADAFAELRGLGGDGEYKYTVSRVSSEPGRKPGYCRTYSLGDLSLDAIRDEFGGGKYRVRVTDQQGKYRGMSTFDIVDLPKPAGAANAAPAPTPQPGADLQGLAAILSAVKPASGESGLTSVLAAMIASQGEMMKAIANRQPDKGPSITEILAIINASNKKDDGGSLDTLLKGIELGKSLAGGGGDDDGMIGVARQGLELITPLLSQNAQNPPARPAAPARQLAPPIPNATERAPVVPIPNATEVAPVAPLAQGGNVKVLQQIEWIRKQVAVLVHHAARGKDPELYAEVLLDNLPPFITPGEIMEHIGAADAVAKLAKLDERVNHYAQWFEEFRAAVVDFLQPDDEQDDLPGGAELDAPGEGGGDV